MSRAPRLTPAGAEGRKHDAGRVRVRCDLGNAQIDSATELRFAGRTIPVGSSSVTGSPVAVRPDDAQIQGNQTVAVSINSTSGGSSKGASHSTAVAGFHWAAAACW